MTSAPDAAWLTPGRLLTLVLVLVGSYAALVAIRALQGVLTILLVSLFLSFAMEPAVQYLSHSGWRRGTATGAVFGLVLLGSIGLLAAMAPLVIGQVEGLLRSFPRYLEQFNRELSPLPLGPDLQASPDLSRELVTISNELGGRVRTFALAVAQNVVTFGATAVGVLFELLTVSLITFYLVADGPRFRRALAGPLPPERQREMLAIWELAVTKTGGYIYSRLLLAVICAGSHALVLVLLGVPYPLPLGLWIGVVSAFVPVVGTYLGGLLLLFVAFVNDPLDAAWVLGFLILYQQVENYFLAPRIQARTMDVHPAVAFVSVLVGGSLLGAVGALLALPATAIIQALLSTYMHRHELIAELNEYALPARPVAESEPPFNGDGVEQPETKESVIPDAAMEEQGRRP